MIKITKPTLLIDKEKALTNLDNMFAKVKQKPLMFRPHFKTHQSAEIGRWFKEKGITQITVSSVEMAEYFAQHGFQDITIAFPCNILEIDSINQLASRIELGLLVESEEVIQYLNRNLKFPVNIWIKIDTGLRRTGIEPKNVDFVLRVLQSIIHSKNMRIRGLLTHCGHTYQAKNQQEIIEIYHKSMGELLKLQDYLSNQGHHTKISIGDTPSCSLIDHFKRVDEIRPGNFIFYDLMQSNLGVCSENEIAVAVACPVVAKHEDRLEIVIYGGAVHLSKELIIDYRGNKCFGKVAELSENGWTQTLPETYVRALSQEHGIVKTPTSIFNRIKIGDVLVILPVHSCLTVNLMRTYHEFNGKKYSVLG
ncbi:MAG: alanine racemase [Spirochaetes bacterium]|nr:alanine racemase [Spirochaetota bacterium]